jgi:hypothetical protein
MTPPTQPLIQTIAHIERTYPNEWVLVKETAWKKNGHPTKGIVIAHSPDRDGLVPHTIRLHEQEPEVKTYAFYTGPILPEDMVCVL